MAAGYSQCQFT